MVSVWKPDEFSILITDDDLPTRRSVGEALDVCGYRTHLAGSGSEALDLVKREFCHLAILDLNLPDTTGLEIARILSEVTGRRMPCILMSGQKLDVELIKSEEVFVCSFLLKPIDLGSLRSSVYRTLWRCYGVGSEEGGSCDAS